MIGDRSWLRESKLKRLCREGDLEGLIELKAKYDIEYGSSWYRSFRYECYSDNAMHVAAQYNQAHIIRFLASVDQSLIFDSCIRVITPLYCAIDSGNKEAVQALVQLGAATSLVYIGMWQLDPSYGAIEYAARIGRMDVVDCMLQEGVDINSGLSIGRTPVHVASGMGDVDIFQELVKRGADIGRADFNEYTCLHYAVACGKLEMVRYLVDELGFDIERKNLVGYTALGLAMCENRIAIAEFLISRGARFERNIYYDVGYFHSFEGPTAMLCVRDIDNKMLFGCIKGFFDKNYKSGDNIGDPHIWIGRRLYKILSQSDHETISRVTNTLGVATDNLVDCVGAIIDKFGTEFGQLVRRDLRDMSGLCIRGI
jgi:ankyrin repeat protein